MRAKSSSLPYEIPHSSIRTFRTDNISPRTCASALRSSPTYPSRSPTRRRSASARCGASRPRPRTTTSTPHCTVSAKLHPFEVRDRAENYDHVTCELYCTLHPRIAPIHLFLSSSTLQLQLSISSPSFRLFNSILRFTIFDTVCFGT